VKIHYPIISGPSQRRSAIEIKKNLSPARFRVSSFCYNISPSSVFLCCEMLE